jgi:ribosome-associated protein
MPEPPGEDAERESADPPQVPENEIDIDFVRSSGPGGQNVNKTSSKAQLRWSPGRSRTFTEEQRAAIRAHAGNRLNAADEIVLAEQSERSQLQNRETVVQRLQELVAEALRPKKERKATKVGRSQKEKRLEDKRRESRKKQDRKSSKGEW